jgi:hypothetical protein
MYKQTRPKTVGRIAIMIALMFAGESVMSIEQPNYTVIYKGGDIEYRQYDSYLVAETIIDDVDDYSAAGNEGFRRLFRYITGGNQSQSEISMTAPVQQTSLSEKITMTAPVQQTNSVDGWRVAFMLPGKYTMDTAPVPADPRIRIREIEGRLMAVLRYSGRWTERNLIEQRSSLMMAIDASGIELRGEMQSALYDPPYTPPFMRRNEVMVEVNRSPAATVSAGAEQFTIGRVSY